jgi:hypothetical protein
MTPERRERLIASITSIVAVVPWGVFMGTMFVSFGGSQISWGTWLFDIITFWNPVFAAFFSFVRARFSAYWILASVFISMAMSFLYEAHTALQPDSRHLSAMEWLETIPSFLYVAVGFWLFPQLAVAALLYATRSREQNPPLGT